MQESGYNETQQSIEKPIAVTVFGVLNVVFGCYFLMRIGHSWYKVISIPKVVMWSNIMFFLLGMAGLAVAIWLIALGIGLLKMKRWSRRGSIIYAWIQIVFMVIALAATVINSIADRENAPRVLLASVNLNNALAVIHWIYMILLLIFMRTEKIKRAFAAIGG
jgi:hypothetical protein